MSLFRHHSCTSRVVTTGVVAAMLLATAACTSAVDQQQAGTGGPRRGGDVTIAQSADAAPGSVLAGRLGNSTWAANVFQTLTVLDAQREPQPLLATSWELASDGLSIDVHLRDDVTFSTGRKLTATDVKFSLEQAADPANGTQTGYIASQFIQIEAVDDTTVHIEFAKSLPNLFDLFEQVFIVDQDTYSGLQDGSEVIGTGPYLFESWQPGAALRLVRNPDYWGEQPYLDAIDIAVITDETALVNAVRSGRAQLALGMNTVDAQSFAADSNYAVTTGAESVYPLGLDVTKAPLDAKAVRQAIGFAIDRDRINDQVFGGEGEVTSLYWDPSTPGYPDDLAQHYTYQPDRAAQMIEDSGAAGAEVPINVIGLPNNTSLAEIVSNNLEAVGLRPTINVVDQASFGQRQLESQLGDAWLPLHGLNGLAPGTLVDTLPSLRESTNPSHFDTPRYDKLLATLRDATDDAAQSAALQALSTYLVDQAFTLPLLQDSGQLVSAVSVGGVSMSARGYLDLSTAYTTQD